MKKILTILFVLFFSVTAFSQADDEILVFLNVAEGSLGLWDATHGEFKKDVWQIGSMPNQVYHYKNNTFVVCSGSFNEGDTKLIVIPDAAFLDYRANHDSTIFENSATVIQFETYGNAWNVVGLTDSTALVTLSGTSKLEIINFRTGEIVSEIENINGNPQGACDFNENYVAVAVADWGYGLDGNSVIFVDKQTGEVAQSVTLRKNVVSVFKLEQGGLLAATWGTWSGEDNYGTVSRIDENFNVTATLYPADSAKAYSFVQLNDNYIHINAYSSTFQTVTAVIDLQNNTDSTVTEGFWAKHIIGKFSDGHLIAQDMTGLAIYNENGDSLMHLDYVDVQSLTTFILSPNAVEDYRQTVSEFELSQNYPNPFNPTTNITYVIPSVIARSEATRQSTELSVQLKVYDALGREVATLVNAKQTPGKYSVQFNASNLSSGVYFYTLRAGNFVQTKKMILMK